MAGVENLKKEPGKKGGARLGAGRKAGGHNKDTLRRQKVLEAFRKRVERHAALLFDAQMTLARGVTYLYKIVETTDAKGVSHKSKPILVTTRREIEDFLAGKKSEQDEPNEEGYYFITTDKPDNKAIDSLLDRTFGKATQPLSGNPDDPEGERVGVVIYRPEKLPDAYDAK